MEDVYMLSNVMLATKIGENLKASRLKQNISQKSLAMETGLSLSSVKKIEKGEIGSFDSLLRVLRVLGKLDVMQTLVQEEPLSPSAYYEMVRTRGAHLRKRAARKVTKMDKEESV